MTRERSGRRKVVRFEIAPGAQIVVVCYPNGELARDLGPDRYARRLLAEARKAEMDFATTRPQ